MTTYALLKSPVEFQLNSKITQSSPSQRPKLSLNTTNHRSYGRSSTALRLDAFSEASPTFQNTYRNTYGSQPDTLQGTHSSSVTPAKHLAAKEFCSDCHDIIDQKSGGEGLITVKTLEHTTTPYNLSTEARSILINSPLTKQYRSSDAQILCSQRPTNAKNSRHRPKRVCFREPLSEEIHNSKFVLKHSDLRSRSSSPVSKSTKPRRSTLRTASQGSPPPLKSRVSSSNVPSITAGDDDDCVATDRSADNNNSDTRAPKTPVSGRHKEREWVWTLGSLPGFHGPGSASQVDDSSDEDLEQSLGETVTAASGFMSKS